MRHGRDVILTLTSESSSVLYLGVLKQCQVCQGWNYSSTDRCNRCSPRATSQQWQISRILEMIGNSILFLFSVLCHEWQSWSFLLNKFLMNLYYWFDAVAFAFDDKDLGLRDRTIIILFPSTRRLRSFRYRTSWSVQVSMKIISSDVRCCVLIRGIRSSTTKEMVNTYAEQYGHINYSHSAISAQGVMRGYNVVFKQEQSVNRFMDNRPHRIDGHSGRVFRSRPGEWSMMNL